METNLISDVTEKTYWVYILKCDNESYYTGYTDNLEQRFNNHMAGKGSKYTRSFKPISIAQSWEIKGDKSKAMRLEYYIKTLSRTKKEELIKDPKILITCVTPHPGE